MEGGGESYQEPEYETVVPPLLKLLLELIEGHLEVGVEIAGEDLVVRAEKRVQVLPPGANFIKLSFLDL